MKRYFVGIQKRDLDRDLLRMEYPIPCDENGYLIESDTTKLYHYLIGPFRTKRGATYHRDNGRSGVCLTVRDAERLSKGLKA